MTYRGKRIKSDLIFILNNKTRRYLLIANVKILNEDA